MRYILQEKELFVKEVDAVAHHLEVKIFLRMASHLFLTLELGLESLLIPSVVDSLDFFVDVG